MGGCYLLEFLPDGVMSRKIEEHKSNGYIQRQFFQYLRYLLCMLTILYEDNHLIAVNKPAGVIVQGDKTGDTCLMENVKMYLKEKYHKPGNVFLGLVHRLDRPVSGIVLFAKTSKGASRIAKQFRERTIQKIYHALVECQDDTQLKSAGTLVHYLKKNTQKNITTVYDTPEIGALRAELDYKIVSKQHKKALVQIILKTGRSHQIRAQFAHMGCPIVGDTKYGAKMRLSSKGHMIALCATDLTFMLATKSESRTLHQDIPSEWPVS